jgi:hypothetical protein
MKRAGLVTGAAALSLTAYAQASDALGNDDLQARLLAAEARIAELETSNGDRWLTEQRSDEIRGLVQDVLADADLRASLMGSGITAGWDNGAVLGSSDGNWMLRINGLLQARFEFNHQEAGDANDTNGNKGFINDTYRYGFELARAQLIFSGNVVNPSWTYMIQGDFGSDTVREVGVNLGDDYEKDRDKDQDIDGLLRAWGYKNIAYDNGQGTGEQFGDYGSSFSGTLGNFALKNAWIKWDMSGMSDMMNGMSLQVGQFKSPFLREELIWGGYQLAIDRSNMNYIFTQGYTQGVMVNVERDSWRVSGTFNDGANRQNTPWNAETTEWSFGGRGEYKFSGTWSQFDEFTSPKGQESGIMVGVASYYSSEEFGTGYGTGGGGGTLGQNNQYNTNEVKNFGITADVTVQFGGANLFGAFVYRNSETNFDDDSATGLEGTAQQFGFVVQGGLMVTESWEAFARYNYTSLDIDGLNDPNALTLGANRYFHGQNLKWTIDASLAFTRMDVASSAAGWRPDPDGSNHQWLIRTQLQLAF